MSQIIHIFGGSGSGTSTLGRYLCEQKGLFFMDTDDYYWEQTNPPFTTKRDSEERLRLFLKDVNEHEIVVISGAMCGWGDVVIPYFKLAIRIELDKKVRMERLIKREKERFGKRIEPGGDMYEIHQPFLKWAENYDTGGLDMRSKATLDEWQKKLACPIVSLDGERSLEDHIKVLKHYLDLI